MTDDAPKFREGQQQELTTQRGRQRELGLWVVLLAVVATLGCISGAVGYVRSSQATSDNCVRIARIVDVGGQIIADPDAQGRPGKTLRQYRDDGLLSAEQYARAIDALKRQLARWRSADCPPPELP